MPRRQAAQIVFALMVALNLQAVLQAATARVTMMTPAPNDVVSNAPVTVTVTFSKNLNALSVTASSCVLTRAGADGTFGTADDVVVTPTAVTAGTNQIQFDLSGIAVPNDLYRVRLNGGSPFSTNGLVAHWAFDETTGATAADSTGGGHVATLTGGPTWVLGRLGNALQFDGVNDRGAVPHAATIDPTAAWTLACWVKRSNSGAQHSLLEKYSGAAGNGNYAMRILNDNRLAGYLIHNPDFETVVGTTQLSAGQWYHVAITFNDTARQLKAYVNGILENTLTVTGPTLATTGQLRIGARGDDGNTLLFGAIDDARIYNRTLAATEIQTLAQTLPLVFDVDSLGIDGEFSGLLPSGDLIGGGDFIADFRVNAPTLRVTGLSVPNNSVLPAPPGSLAVTLSHNPVPNSINAATVQLTRAGSDGMFGTGDDVPVLPALINQAGNMAVLDLTGVPMPFDRYRLTLLAAGIPDDDANLLDGEFAGTLPSGDGVGGGNFSAQFILRPPPVANDGELRIKEDSIGIGALGAISTQSPLTFQLVANGTKGTAEIVPGSSQFIYTPQPGISGVDMFTFKVNDGAFDSNVATVVVVITPVNDPPALVSGVVATPHPARVNAAVTLSVAAADVENDALTYAWTFGDGGNATGSTVTHQYATRGIYRARVSITDPSGTGVESGRDILVVPDGTVGGGPDTDGDSYSDAFEIAAGTSPADAADSPFSADDFFLAMPLAEMQLAVKLNFAKPKGDGIQLKAALVLPDGFTLADEPVLFDIGGIARVFKLDKKGTRRSAGGTIKVKSKGDGARIAQLALTLSKSSFAFALVDDGLVNASVKTTVTIPVSVMLGTTLQSGSATLQYFGVEGRSGRTLRLRAKPQK